MYENYFGLTTKPFSLAPDPSFLFRSRQHAMAMTMLMYSLESQAAFSLLTGDIGSGKTTLVRSLLRRLGDQVVVGLISHTHARLNSINAWALSALGIVPPNDSDIAQYEALVESCIQQYAKGRRTLLIIDEAQNLSLEVLEELRLLSNINSERDLVLQILLVGQPELRRKLACPNLKQFAQRVSVDFHLKPLDRSETHDYVRHRLKVAGRTTALFLPEAIDLVHARTEGVPRLMNQLCDFALVYAYADRRTMVDAELVAEVVRDRSTGIAFPALKAVELETPVARPHNGAA